MLLIVLLVGDLIAPSGRGSSVSSEGEGRNFSHANDGGQGEGADSRPSVSLRRGGESPPFDTDVRSDGVLQWARNKREKLWRSRGEVAMQYTYSFVYVRGLKDYVPR